MLGLLAGALALAGDKLWWHAISRCAASPASVDLYLSFYAAYRSTASSRKRGVRRRRGATLAGGA
jgi:hypothetical protein